jgi:alanine dehydrogenase
MEVLVLAQSDVEALLEGPELLDALAAGFAALSAGRVSAPPRNQVATERGVLLAMPAYIAGGLIGVKQVTVFHDNHDLGIPAHQAMITLFDGATGSTVAIMDGTRVTAMRTAAGAAISARYSARINSKVLTIVGAGVQGHTHLDLVPLVRDIAEIRIVSPNIPEAARLAERDDRASVYLDAEDAVRGADIVCLCTSSGTPVIEDAWVEPGTHVTSVGYYPPTGELPPTLAARAHLIVETRAAFEAPPVGCGELAGLDPSMAFELGEIVAGSVPARMNDDQITVYKSMGHAMEDLVAAQLVYERAIAAGLGQIIEL